MNARQVFNYKVKGFNVNLPSEIIKAVFENYGHYTGGQLSTLTHRPRTPWSETWERKKFGVIDPQVIKQHYQSLIETA